MGDFSGSTAFVTGGSRGVGRAIALEFAGRGANVAIVYKLSRESADAVVAEIASHGGNALALQADVGDCDAISNDSGRS
jgi:NAD(P)-dependent dehydrogenase (short-subunit alcohol dehydrogenase family)